MKKPAKRPAKKKPASPEPTPVIPKWGAPYSVFGRVISMTPGETITPLYRPADVQAAIDLVKYGKSTDAKAHAEEFLSRYFKSLNAPCDMTPGMTFTVS